MIESNISDNWSGYVASGTDSATDAPPISFTQVAGSWVQPKANCQAVASATASSFWVGLGGNAVASIALEQVGTDSDCKIDGTASYYAWYELVPAGSVRLGMTIEPGDRIAAAVTVDGEKVTISIEDVTRHRDFLKTFTMASPDTSSAEWIAEAPTHGFSGPNSDQTALTDFGKVTFTGATATSGTDTGPISDHTWSHGAVELQIEGSLSGPNGSQPTLDESVPSSLSGHGSTFTISWRTRPASATSSGGNSFSSGIGTSDGV